MRYYRGCLIDRNYEFMDAAGRFFEWAAWSVDQDYVVVCGMSLRELYARIDDLLGLGVRVKCALCDDYGITEGIGGREVACPCGLSEYLADTDLTDVSADGPVG